jgi:dTDP-glucose pyrophosphorylase
VEDAVAAVQFAERAGRGEIVNGSPTDKAVVLARGIGSRMRNADSAVVLSDDQRQAAEAGVKAMVPIGRPFLDYLLNVLADSGFRRICLVIGPEHQKIRDYYQRLPLNRLQVSFAVQQEPRGTADAVAAAERFADGDHFLVVNSDNLYPAAACRALKELGTAATAAFDRDALIRLGNISADKVARYAVLTVAPDGTLQCIEEKPDPALFATLKPPIYVSMNCWLFPPAIFEACRKISPSSRGELEMASAVNFAIRELDVRFRAQPFEAGVLDLSSREDIPKVAEYIAQTEVQL